MGTVEARIQELGLTRPAPLEPPPGVVLPFEPVIVVGTRAVFSGHGPQADDGGVASPAVPQVLWGRPARWWSRPERRSGASLRR